MEEVDSDSPPIYEVLPVEVIARILRLTDADLKWLMKFEFVSKWFQAQINNRFFWKLLKVSKNLHFHLTNVFGKGHGLSINNNDIFIEKREEFVTKLFQRLTFTGLIIDSPYSVAEFGSYLQIWNREILDADWLIEPLFRVIHLYPNSLSLRKLEIRGCDSKEQVNLANKLVDIYGTLELKEIVCINTDNFNCDGFWNLVKSSCQSLEQIRLGNTSTASALGTASQVEKRFITIPYMELHSLRTLILENLHFEVSHLTKARFPNLRTLQVLRTLSLSPLKLFQSLDITTRSSIRNLAISFRNLQATDLVYKLMDYFPNLENCLLDYFDVGGYSVNEIQEIVHKLLTNYASMTQPLPSFKIVIVTTVETTDDRSKIVETLNKHNLCDMKTKFGQRTGYCKFVDAKLVDVLNPYRHIFQVVLSVFFDNSVKYTTVCPLVE